MPKSIPLCKDQRTFRPGLVEHPVGTKSDGLHRLDVFQLLVSSKPYHTAYPVRSEVNNEGGKIRVEQLAVVRFVSITNNPATQLPVLRARFR